MKTVRYFTYETNSSSTHAYTVSSVSKTNRPDLNIIPDDDGCIRIGFTQATESTPQDKLGHILNYANFIGDQEMYDRVLKVVEEFTGAKVIVSCKIWKDKGYVTIDNLREVTNPKLDFNDLDYDSVRDEWYSYTCGYGHGSVEEFCSVMNEIGSSEENIRIFIFSSKQGVDVETYYDG